MLLLVRFEFKLKIRNISTYVPNSSFYPLLFVKVFKKANFNKRLIYLNIIQKKEQIYDEHVIRKVFSNNNKQLACETGWI